MFSYKHKQWFFSVLSKKTYKLLSAIHFTSDDILQIIIKIDPNKAHGHDMVSIRMIKICDASICKPLKLIFRSCFQNGKFPTEWKKANMVPVHRKEDDKTWKATVQYLCFLLMEKYLKKYCIITCMNSLKKII